MTLNSRHGALILVLTGALACEPRDVAAPSPILIDGEFDEWVVLPALVTDPVDVPDGAAVDIGEVKAHSDGRFLYFSLETRHAVNAQAMLGTLSILLDADGDSQTGVSVEDLKGVDLVLELSRKDQLRDGGFGAGIGVRRLDAGGTLGVPTNAGDFDVIVAPTSAARRFEIRMLRGTIEDNGSPLFAGNEARAQVVYEVAGETMDQTAVARIELSPLGDAAIPATWSEPLDPADGDVRVVVWNVASEGFRDRAERFARVLGGLKPHVILLDEVFGEVVPADLDAFFAMDPVRSLGEWDYVLGRSGGRQKTVVASRIGVRAEPAAQDLLYPPGSLADLEAAFPNPRAQRLFGLERERGLASVGAWVDVAGLPVLFVPIDLQSAGYAGSFEDELRKLQAKALRDIVAAVLAGAGEPAAAVIGGDLNLVGSHDPLDILVRGLDQDGADLVPADARRLTDRSYATWRSSDAPFTPGRLDFVLVPERVLEVTRAFAFDAGELSEQLRESLGIGADDPTMTSDHLPLVVDLARRRYP